MRYVCTVTDLFTKWMFAGPIKSNSAGDVASVLLKLINSYGPPKKKKKKKKKKIMDQGCEFINQVCTMS